MWWGNQASFIPEFISYVTTRPSREIPSTHDSYLACEFIFVSLQAAGGNVAEKAFITNLWCVYQAQGILQEYLLAMTTDEQLLDHTAMVRLSLLFCLFA